MALVVSNPPASEGNVKDPSPIPGSGRSPGEGHMATHSSVLAGRMPHSEESGRLESTESHSLTRLKQLSTQSPHSGGSRSSMWKPPMVIFQQDRDQSIIDAMK